MKIVIRSLTQVNVGFLTKKNVKRLTTFCRLYSYSAWHFLGKFLWTTLFISKWKERKRKKTKLNNYTIQHNETKSIDRLSYI